MNVQQLKQKQEEGWGLQPCIKDFVRSILTGELLAKNCYIQLNYLRHYRKIVSSCNLLSEFVLGCGRCVGNLRDVVRVKIGESEGFCLQLSIL